MRRFRFRDAGCGASGATRAVGAIVALRCTMGSAEIGVVSRPGSSHVSVSLSRPVSRRTANSLAAFARSRVIRRVWTATIPCPIGVACGRCGAPGGALRVALRARAADGRERGDGRPDGRRGDAVSDVGPAHAPVQAIGCDRMGRGAGEGGVSLSKLPSGRWRAQVYDSVARAERERVARPGWSRDVRHEVRGEAGARAGPRSASAMSATDGRDTPWLLGALDDAIRCSPGRRSPRTSTIASAPARSSSATAPGGWTRSMTRLSRSGSRAASATARSRRCGRCSTTPPRRRAAGWCARTRLRGSGYRVVLAADMSSRRARSRSGS